MHRIHSWCYSLDHQNFGVVLIVGCPAHSAHVVLSLIIVVLLQIMLLRKHLGYYADILLVMNMTVEAKRITW